MPHDDLIAILREAFELAGTEEREGPAPHIKAKFVVRLIEDSIPRFWEQDPILVGVALERQNFRYIAIMREMGAAGLGLAIRQLRLEAMATPQSQDGALGDFGPPEGLWANFIFDEQLTHPKYTAYKVSRLFRSLVEDHVPAALSPRWDETCTLGTIIWAQHAAVLEYRRVVKPAPGTELGKFIENSLIAMRSHDNLDLFLAVHNASEEAFCLQWPGLLQDEWEAMQDGHLTLEDVYVTRPAFVIRQLLPKRAARN